MIKIKKCNCGGTFYVLDTQTLENSLIWRRRVCDKCKRTIYTAEIATSETPAQARTYIKQRKGD